MDPDADLVLDKYISSIGESLEKFSQRANEELFRLTNNLNRCQANLLILEKKLASFQNQD